MKHQKVNKLPNRSLYACRAENEDFARIRQMVQIMILGASYCSDNCYTSVRLLLNSNREHTTISIILHDSDSYFLRVADSNKSPRDILASGRQKSALQVRLKLERRRTCWSRNSSSFFEYGPIYCMRCHSCCAVANDGVDSVHHSRLPHLQILVK